MHFPTRKELARSQVDRSQGLASPVTALLFILPAVGGPGQILSKGSEMILLNPSQSNKKKLHRHVRWEPIEMPTKRELGLLQRFQDFSFIMQNTQLSRGEVGLAKKSQQISFLICFKLLKCPVSLPLSPEGLWALFTFIREFLFF